MAMAEAGYRIDISDIDGELGVTVGGEEIARSNNAVLMRETRLPDCVYFPQEAIDAASIERSDFRTFCPFKGTASYWHLNTPKGKLENALWAYETPLKESSGIEGMFSVSRQFIEAYDPPLPNQDQSGKRGHIASPLSDWILREAQYCKSREDLISAYANRLVDTGIAVSRLSIILWSLHPEIAGARYVWRRDTGEITISEPNHEIFDNPAYLNSPLNLVSQGLGGVRQPLNSKEAEFDFSIFDDLRAEGATDYVAMPLRFSDGQINSMTLACDHPDGFTTENLGLVFECAGPISRYLEVMTLRKNATTLMDTYIGKRSGQRVLDGDIRRGQGEDIEAVILFSDLRNSTRLAEDMPRQDYLELLNRYFDMLLEPIEANGGEVLKFIGDAVLAIFPISEENGDRKQRAGAALAAARSAIENISPLPNVAPNGAANGSANTSASAIDLGISLHVGDVTYGNVGGKNRLDFTVVGPAVNLASRIESLCKQSGRRILMSQDFVDALDSGSDSDGIFQCVGQHDFSGIKEIHSVFALAAQ